MSYVKSPYHSHSCHVARRSDREKSVLQHSVIWN